MLLPIRKVEKVWGRERLPAPFDGPQDSKIGEIWFEPPPEMSGLLVKYLFTSENLSVQCHPSDEQTLAKGLGRQGKDECWVVLDAEPGARLGIGFRHEVTPEEMHAAALDGSIEDLLAWHDIEVGDFFYIPANTVHAIGPGCAIIEIQQNSDVTYRLYDYGRDRELHLDEGVEVADGSPYDLACHRQIPSQGDVALVDGPHFLLDRVDGEADETLYDEYEGALLVIPEEGEVMVDGETVAPGQCALAPNLASITFAIDGKCLIAQTME